MKLRVLAVLVSVALLALLMPLRAAQRAGEEPRWRVRIVVSNVEAMKASLEISGYDVLETNSDDSAIELVVSASEFRALEKSGFSVVRIEQSHPLFRNADNDPMSCVGGGAGCKTERRY